MKIALGLDRLTDSETLALANTIATAMAAPSPITPDPTVAALNELIAAAQDAMNKAATARQQLTADVSAKNHAVAVLKNALTQEAANVEARVDTYAPAQQQAFIEAAGMAVQSAPTHVAVLDPVLHLSLTASDTPGALDWHCDPVARAAFYMVEYTTDPMSPTAKWTAALPSTKSRGELAGLPSGAAVSVRVHAQGKRDTAGAPMAAGPKVVP